MSTIKNWNNYTLSICDLDVIGKIFSFIENFFCCKFFFSKRMEEHRDLAKKKTERTMGKGAKVMVVRVINAPVNRSHLL